MTQFGRAWTQIMYYNQQKYHNRGQKKKPWNFNRNSKKKKKLKKYVLLSFVYVEYRVKRSCRQYDDISI